MEPLLLPNTSVPAVQGLGEPFSFPFRDAQWAKKLLIAVLLALANFVLPVLPGLILAGYNLEIMRRIVQGDSTPELPAWENWGRMLADGFRLLGICMLYFLPVLLLTMLSFGVTVIPTLIGKLAAASQEGTAPIIPLLPLLGTIGGVIIISLVALLGITLAALLPMAVVHFAFKEHFRAAFQIGEWWKVMRANFTDFLVAYVIFLAFNIFNGLILTFLSFTVILCLVIPILESVIIVYGWLLFSALLAQGYREGMQKLEIG